jgi:lysyl-tRNA synthetase class II
MYTVKELREKYDNDKLGNGQYDEKTVVGVKGRAMAIREQGKKLVFIDLVE